MPHPVDGFPDLVVHFEVENIDLEAGDTEATLTGKLFPGEPNETPFEGTDFIRIVRDDCP